MMFHGGLILEIEKLLHLLITPAMSPLRGDLNFWSLTGNLQRAIFATSIYFPF